MEDQRGPYFRALTESDRDREYWLGESPDDPGEQWYFETVEDSGQKVAIRQITVGPAGRFAYSAAHLEDEHGFLTDQPMSPVEEGLAAVEESAFEAVWATRTNF